MKSDHPPRKPLKVGGFQLTIALAATGFVLPSLAEAAKLPSADGNGAIVVAGVVPAPPGRPGRKPPPKSIGELISAAEDDAGGAPSAEDSDVAAGSAPVAVAPRPAGVILEKPNDLSPVAFKLALKLLENGDPTAAGLAAYALPDKTDIKIINWLVATSGLPGVSSARIADAMKKLAGWPGQQLLRLRFEQELAHENKSPAEIVSTFSGQTPVSGEGTLLLARAYLALGRKEEAAQLIRPYWRDGKIPQDTETAIAKEFEGLLTLSDHKARMDRLLYTEQSEPALRTAAFLGKDQRALATAVISVIKRSRSDKAMAAVPAAEQ